MQVAGLGWSPPFDPDGPAHFLTVSILSRATALDLAPAIPDRR
jgi:hypothetical protein